MTPTPQTPHPFTDSEGRNLCDICDRWQGAKVHGTPAPDERDAQIAALLAAANEALYNWQNPDKAREHDAMNALSEVVVNLPAAAQERDERLVKEWEDFIDEYADHHEGCPAREWSGIKPACTCGFDEARNLLNTDASKERGE